MSTNKNKYKKKPVIVEAYQTDEEIIISTLEGDMKASIGDYVVTGVDGEKYPCKPEIFKKTYESVWKEVKKMLKHHITKYRTSDGEITAVSWVQLNVFNKCLCFSKKIIKI